MKIYIKSYGDLNWYESVICYICSYFNLIKLYSIVIMIEYYCIHCCVAKYYRSSTFMVPSHPPFGQQVLPLPLCHFTNFGNSRSDQRICHQPGYTNRLGIIDIIGYLQDKWWSRTSLHVCPLSSRKEAVYQDQRNSP